MPKRFSPYKLLLILGIDNNSKPYIISYILIKYLVHITYDRIFSYFHENYNFH